MTLTYASFYRERFITVLSDTSDGVRIFVHHWPSTHRHYLFFFRFILSVLPCHLPFHCGYPKFVKFHKDVFGGSGRVIFPTPRKMRFRMAKKGSSITLPTTLFNQKKQEKPFTNRLVLTLVFDR